MIVIFQHVSGDNCPQCGNHMFSYDDFEDMYCCNKCDTFLYPEDIGRERNEHAGIWCND